MLRQGLKTLCLASTFSILTGCAAIQTNTRVSHFDNPVNEVVTEYSDVLQCLGNRIEDAQTPVLQVYITDIEDRTVPFRFRERRLSKGGSWWFHTAIGKLETDRVISVTSQPSRQERSSASYLEISGAWTQDDAQVGVNSKRIGFSNLDLGVLDRLGWFGRDEASVIAGDFVSTVNGRVVHSSAISLVVNESGQNYQMRIEDGSRRFDFGLRSEANEGPQFAQRRIVEAATLVHISNRLQIDYADCVEQNLVTPEPISVAAR